MNKKIQSEILSIDLDEATYKDTKTSIKPTFINFFFGNNGTGKSTIAKAIQANTGISYKSGKSLTDYNVLVFNQEFINNNLASYHNLQGVFTLNSKNASIQAEIDTLEKDKNDAITLLSEYTKNYEAKVTEKNDLKESFYKECFDSQKDFRANFNDALIGKKKKDTFTEEVMLHTPKDLDVVELKRMYDSAYSKSSQKYNLFNEINDINCLDNIKNSDILSVSIVNSADTDLAKTLRKIGSLEWMHKGHEEYVSKADGVCPYCARKLDDDFEEQFLKSFDKTYQDNISTLSSFLEEYKNKANVLFLSLQAIPSEIYPEIDLDQYNAKLNSLKITIQENIERIKSKIDNPSTKVTINTTKDKLDEIEILILNFNKLIKENNDIVDNRTKMKKECTESAFSILAYILKEKINEYKSNDANMQKELKLIEDNIKHQKSLITDANAKLTSLRSKTVETETAKNSINAILKDSGIQGFSLVPKVGVPNVYEVRRDDGTIATNLSEGEKNFIAFLYFYHLVLGSTSEEGDSREKIVVIDDPVSSMDSSSLFIVSSLVRRMIEICKNSADYKEKKYYGHFIKQIFILTHNAYFHREITHGYVNKYEYVSFYLIKKINNKSSVILCEKTNPNEPINKMNYNPLKNSYATLWDEYREVTSSSSLMNVIRRILEFYFIQLCGYEGTTLQERILVKDKARFKTDEEFQTASAMLSYITGSSKELNDGFYYVEDYLDVEQCKNVFEAIFDIMDQKQHYDMMLGK